MKSILWKILALGSAVMAATASNTLLTVVWRGFTGQKPPTVPEDPETTMAEALGWAAVSGAVIGIVRMIAVRRAAAYYVKSTGEMPKALIRK